MVMRRSGLALLFLAACSSAGPVTVPSASHSPATSSPAGSPSPAQSSAYAIVFVPGPSPFDSTISVIDNKGQVVASAPFDIGLYQPAWQARPGSVKPNSVMSSTSASRTRLYYLYGGSEVRFIALDGSTGTATRIALGSYEQAAFAVSPDDTRIAVAVFRYSPPPVSTPSASPTYKGMRLYVEDLQGGGHHVDIFSSATVAEFPIGWTSGRLVMAVGNPFCCFARILNPYGATSYNVVDPATGMRLGTLCTNGSGPIGPLEPAGAMCLEGSAAPEFQRWDGGPFAAPGPISDPTQYLAGLSPDGTRVAVGGNPITIWGPSGSSDSFAAASGYVFGWLDDQHIVFRRPDANGLWVLDINTRASLSISAVGSFMGTVPAAIT